MNWPLLKNGARWAWLLAMVTFVVVFAIKRKDLVAAAFSRLSLETLCLSALLILLAKLCLVANMRRAARRFAIRVGWIDAFWIYNVTEMGKYIPGSIWQFVGRIGVLRERNAAPQSIRDSILAEHLWAAGSASLLGVVLAFGTQPELCLSWMCSPDFESKRYWVLALAGAGVGAIAVAVALGRKAIRWMLRLLPTPRAMMVLPFIWLCFGASLWVILFPFLEVKPPFLYVVGVYCIGFVLGFVIPFAPAGLGVREAVLTMALVSYLEPQMLFFLITVNRILNFSVEMLLGGSGLLCRALVRK
ncbi:MAG: hypothetical protein FDZ69_03810 [Deltaproteobacteria bacterium]|nr:MAG: hypothetical protein FDZ69_03810 [Deltaproteobacteria bacterium]